LTAVTAETLNASGMAGALTVATTAAIDDITGGAGADDVDHDADSDLSFVGGAGNDELGVSLAQTDTTITFNGGDGNDTLSLETAMIVTDRFTLTDVEFVDTNNLAMTVDARDFSGQTMVITSTGGVDETFAFDMTNTTSADFSGISGNEAQMAFSVTNTTGIASTITGTQLDDTIGGGSAGDTINGGLGGDTLNGNDGADTLNGGAGADTINGGAGADTINGGEGIDTITGGAGADIIDLTETTAVTDDVNIAVHSTDGIDVITGFQAGALADGGDTIGTTAGAAANYNDLTAEDFSAAATVTAAATLAIVEDNTTNATNAANDAIAFNYGGNMYVVVQTDGDAAAFVTANDALVQLVGVDAADLVAANFIA
jgi:Ca2+-binding RTX toxin-like protein